MTVDVLYIDVSTTPRLHSILVPLCTLRQRPLRLEDPSMSKCSACNAHVGYVPSLSPILMLIPWLVLRLACCGGLQCTFQSINQGKIRDDFGMSGSGCTDCFGAWCCPYCGLGQEEKEAKLRPAGGNAVRGYQQIPRMDYNQMRMGGQDNMRLVS